MSSYQTYKDNVFNSVQVSTNLKVPRYNGLPVDEYGKTGDVVLNLQDNIFYGHDGITWVPLGGSGVENIIGKAYFGGNLVDSNPPTSTGDIVPLQANAWTFVNANLGAFGTSPDIFPDFTNPYIVFPSLSGTDLELRDGVYEINFHVGTRYNPTTAPTVIYPSIYIYDTTNGIFVGRAYETVVFPQSIPPFDSRSTLHARAVVAIPGTRTYRFYYGSFDPNTVNPTLVLNLASPTDTYISVTRICDV